MTEMLRHVHIFSEPAPASSDPINAMLDLWEVTTRLVIEHGGEAALIARLQRLVPERFPVPEPVEPAAPAVVALTADDALLAASGASILAGMAKARRTVSGRGQLETIAGLLARVARAVRAVEPRAEEPAA